MTPAQQRVYDAITQLEKETGMAPSIREIGERAGLSSSSTVQAHVKRLLEAGHIHRATSNAGFTVRGGRES